jgi:TP901 family phage tail tape measure protein
MGVFGGALGATAAIVTRVIGSLGGLASAFRSTGASARQTSSSVNSSSSIFSTVGSVAGSLTSKILGLVGAYAGGQAIKEFGQKVLTTGANFDNAMGMVKAVSRNASDYSADAFMAMEREAFRMGRTTTYSATQAAVALKELTQGGLTTQQAVQSLGDTLTLAETEAMDVGDAARIVTSMMAQFQASASELTDFVDKLAKTSAVSKTSIDQLKYALNYVGTAARSANQPFYEVVSAVGALSTAGVESSQAGTTLRDMLTDLTDTTSYSSRKLQALGIDMSKVDPRANKLSEIIGTLKARGIDAADAMAIFGVRGGLAAGSLITVYKQYMDVLNAVQNQSKGTAAIMQQDVTDNLRKDFDKLAASWDYLINRIFKSGLGQMMRGVTQQLKDFTIEIADFVDTLKNAGQFGDLGEIVSTSLKIGFGTAINYLTGGLVAGIKGYMEFVLGSLRVISDVNLWKGLMEVVTALGNGLSAVIKLAIANFIKGNEDFSTSLIQNVMYAGDLFVHKMKEAAGVVRGIASPSYQKARLEAGDADRRLMAAQSGSAAFAVRNAAIDLQITGSDQSRANLIQASDAYNAYVEPFIKAQNDALKKLEQEGERIGLVGDYKGSREQFAAQARDIVGTAPTDLERSAKEDLAKAKDALPGAAAAIVDIFSKGLVPPIVNAIEGFKPVEVVSQSTLQAQNDRLKTLLKENAPTPAKEPTKTLDKVTQGKQSYGVGEIKMDSKGSTANKAVVDSMKEMGSGTETSKWQSAANPLQKATDNNTKAVNDLTSAINGASKETTAQILPTKPKPGAITESERQTDLATWAATGNMPERLKKDMDAVNSQQRQIEVDRQQVESRNAAIQAQRGLAANISNVTSMFGGSADIGAPILAALKRGVAASFDKEGRPVAQSALELGAPVTSLLQTRSLSGEITKQDLFGMISQVRLGAGIGAGDRGRSLTPQELITPALQNMQTIKPMDFDMKNQLMGLPSLSPSLSDVGSAGSTPMIATVEDKYGEQQVATLSEIKSIMSDMNSNIKNNNKADSTKLVINIV